MASTDLSYPPEEPAVFNASAKVAEILIGYFVLADSAMMNNDLKRWWRYLDAAYMQIDFSLNEKERDELLELWRKINPYDKKSYPLLKEYHLKLRRLCKRYFTIGELHKGPAIWRR